MITVLIPSRMMEKFDHENDATITISSPNKLIDGGRARFVRLARSHHVHINGSSTWRPRAKIIVRLWMRS